MNLRIETNSLAFSKLKNEHGFVKYNIEASLDEVENRDSEVVLKFKTYPFVKSYKCQNFSRWFGNTLWRPG